MVLYCYCDPGTKDISLVTSIAIPENQKMGRVEVLISHEHPAFFDIYRKIHFRLNNEGTDLEETSNLTNSEELLVCLQKYGERLITIGIDPDATTKVDDIITQINTLIAAAPTIEEKFSILHDAVTSMAYFLGAMVKGYREEG